MSSNYSANQYENTFKSHRLQNWCEPKHYKRVIQRPSPAVGSTTFISNDRGHLLPGLVKRGSAWPDFKGTWDLPLHIPPPHINPTARSVQGLNRLRSWGLDPQHSGKARPQEGSNGLDTEQGADEQTSGGVQQDGANVRSAAEARPASQRSCCSTGNRKSSSRNRDCQAVETELGDLPPPRASELEPSAEEPNAGQSTNSRPRTGEERPHSHTNPIQPRDVQQEQ